MDLVADLVAPCPPEQLFAIVEDLTTYPTWLEIVTRANEVADDVWEVDLRGRLGPLARTKRLRMVRTEHRAPARVVFERAEVDGREHSPWRLAVDIEPTPTGSTLRMDLRYEGSMFGPVIERVLRDEIDRSRPRLLALVAAGPQDGAR